MRYSDWPERLAAYIESRERRRFKWGKHAQDCGSFANGAVMAITGRDAMAHLPEYKTHDEADEIVTATPLSEIAASQFPARAIGLAQRGDLALAVLEDLETLMVVEGDTLVGPGRRGLVRLPRSAMTMAWEVS